MMNPRPISYPRPLPQDLPGFDVEAAVARMMDNPDLWWQALTIFHTHFADWEAAWHQSRSTREAERKCVHGLRSAAANIGAVRLAAAAAQLENVLMSSNSPPSSLYSLRVLLFDCFYETQRSVAKVLMLTPSSAETVPS